VVGSAGGAGSLQVVEDEGCLLQIHACARKQKQESGQLTRAQEQQGRPGSPVLAGKVDSQLRECSAGFCCRYHEDQVPSVAALKNNQKQFC
jgi:hypothetical protein